MNKSNQDLSYITYLYDYTDKRKYIDKIFPIYKYYHNFIKLYYHFYNKSKLECSICNFELYVY